MKQIVHISPIHQTWQQLKGIKNNEGHKTHDNFPLSFLWIHWFPNFWCALSILSRVPDHTYIITLTCHFSAASAPTYMQSFIFRPTVVPDQLFDKKALLVITHTVDQPRTQLAQFDSRVSAELSSNEMGRKWNKLTRSDWNIAVMSQYDQCAASDTTSCI